MELEGELSTGLGEGATYIGMEEYQKRFEEKTGFRPFPGTLNLEVDPERLDKLEACIDSSRIETFESEGDRYSGVDIYPVVVEGYEAAILEIDITDHPDSVAEIIAPVELREALNLEDGDRVTCRRR